ncbi:SAM-dependent methyltransferase [Psychrobacter cibarius]|uniref:SAM-dependent methyltransferase n=1 Tax=Psychrobacter cibarius TaxID=282669 RepID=UPI0022341983|nr:SAM-dependent methyltransferase [Psychrobacter cibarius]
MVNNIDTIGNPEEDTVGRVYEYFLGKFAATEGKGGGEFYTPKSVVRWCIRKYAEEIKEGDSQSKMIYLRL